MIAADRESSRTLGICVHRRGMDIGELSLESEGMRPMLTRVKRGAETVATVEAKLSPDAKSYVMSTVWA